MNVALRWPAYQPASDIGTVIGITNGGDVKYVPGVISTANVAGQASVPGGRGAVDGFVVAGAAVGGAETTGPEGTPEAALKLGWDVDDVAVPHPPRPTAAPTATERIRCMSGGALGRLGRDRESAWR